MATGGNFPGCNCGPDTPTCERPTEPVATVGLCLADGTPVAVAVVRDCAGAITSQGWINLATGQFSAGAVPAGAVACGDSRSIQVSGTFCDIDPATGDVLGLVLIEYSYAADGSIAGVRLVDAVTGATYTPQGTVTTCPAGFEQPEADLVVLCDRTGDRTTAFVRDYRRDDNGAIAGHTDYGLDGGPYTPAGQVGACDQGDDEESPGEPCRNCESHLLCDRAGAADIPPGADAGTLPNGVGWSVSCSAADADGWPWPAFPCTVTTPQVWAFDRPVSAVWSTALAEFPPGVVVGEVVMPDGTEPVSIDPTHRWDTATRTLSAAPGAALDGGVSTFRHPGPVSDLTFAQTDAGGAATLRHATTAMTVEPAEPTPFLRTRCRDCAGDIIATVDTTLDGAPYTPAGRVGVCEPAQTPERECVAAVEVLRLCDLNPDAAPDEDGKRCAVPFLRHLVHDCAGALAETRDTAMDGTTPYTPVEAVDCGPGGAPALVEVPWSVVGVEPDPGSDPGRGFIFTLSPDDDPSVTGTVKVTTTATANTACTGAPSEYWFRNPCTYRYEPDQSLRDAATYVRVDLQDFDTFEPVTGLNPPPTRLGGTAYWDGTTVRPTESGGIGQMYYDGPPEAWQFSVGNTGGGNSCSALSFAAVSLRADGCCAPCDGGEAQACRNSSVVLLCDVPTDGAAGPLTAADTAPPTPGTAAGSIVALPGGAPALWAGGPLVFPADPDGSAGDGAQVYRAVAAVLAADRPACDDGTATVTVSVHVRLDGPTPGLGTDGRLSLFADGVQVATASVPLGVPVGYEATLTATAQVPASAVASGTVVAELWLETFHGGGKSWTARDFTSGVAFDVGGCATQFLRTVVTDCETGATVSTTDTTLTGEPYEAAGEVGQCEPAGSGGCCPPERRVDVETGVLCLIDQASGDVVGRVLTEWVYDDQTGERTEQRLVDLATGDPVTVPDGAELTTCPAPDRITRQVCVVESGSAEFLTNAANAAAGVDSDWKWSPDLGGPWYDMFRVAPHPVWTAADAAPNPAHWVGPHADRTVCPTAGETSPPVPATWYTRAAWNLPADVSPESIRIAATILNADNDVVQWRLNDGPWQPVVGGNLAGPAVTFPPTAVPGGRGGQNEVIVQIAEGQPGLACPSPNSAGMILHVIATYDHAPRVWTQVIEPGGQMYYLDENGDRQDAVPAGHRLVPCGGGDGAAPVEPCGDTEVIELCDVAADGSSTRFLRHLTHDCSGAVTAVADTTLDGTAEYVPAGTVGACDPPCRDTSSTLLCDTAATDVITVFDPANTAGSDGWEVVSFTGANPGHGPEAPLPYPAVHGAPYGYPALGARADQNAGVGVPWSGYDTAPVRWVLRKTFTAPQDGVAVAQSVGFRGDGGARVRINGIDAGMYGQWNQPATAGTAQIPVTAGPNTVEIEVRDVGGVNNVIGRLDIAMPRTVQFMRRQTVDCETGEVIATVDTTLDGEPYVVAGQVGQCEPVAECCQMPPPELRVDVETELTCMIDEASGDVVARVLIERVYDDQSGDLAETRFTDPVTGDPVDVPAGAVIGSCEAPCPTAFSTECVGIVEMSEASYDNTSLILGVPGRCGSVQGPGGAFGCATTSGQWTIISWIVDGQEVIAEGSSRGFNGGPCGPGTATNPGMHLNWAQALTNLDPTGAVWSAQNAEGCAAFVGSTGGSDTVYGPMTITGSDNQTTNGTWILGPAQSCVETQYTRVYRQDCDGGISVVWLDQAGNEVAAPEGEYVRCGTGCSPAGGDGLDVEVVALCDVQPDGASVPFLRHVLYDTGGAVALVTDTDLGGLAPYSPSGTVGVCEPEEPRHLVEECRCDDTDGDGVADTDFVEVIAVEADGSLTSVGTYTADMSGPYAPVSPVACPAAGAPGPELDGQAVVLCDVDGAGVATPFIRHLRYNAAGEVIATSDTGLDGVTAYAPAGQVADCGPSDGGGGRDVELVPLCVIDNATGNPIQEILAEAVYDAETGEQAGVRYVDRTTFGPVALPGGTHIGACPQGPPECPAQVIEACRCDDTTGDGTGDTQYVELIAVSCDGDLSPIGTFTADLSAPYAPVAPVPCEPGGAAPATGVQAGRVELAPGDSWSAAAVAGLQSVTATAHEGTGLVTTAEGASTLHSGESVSWSVARDADAALTGPLTITAGTGTVTVGTGTVTVAFTRTVTL